VRIRTCSQHFIVSPLLFSGCRCHRPPDELIKDPVTRAEAQILAEPNSTAHPYFAIAFRIKRRKSLKYCRSLEKVLD
jgi:hypothetical protein